MRIRLFITVCGLFVVWDKMRICLTLTCCDFTDSYGSNIVLQLQGKKTWHFWAPTNANMKLLRSSRIPYEESSIYSSYDPHTCSIQPDMTLTIEAGDALLVPKHWWHFVDTSSDSSFSVNLWIPHFESPTSSLSDGINARKCRLSNSLSCNDDTRDNATEAIVRFIFGAMKKTIDGMEWPGSVTPEVSHCNGWMNSLGISNEELSFDCDEGHANLSEMLGNEDPSVDDADANFELLLLALRRHGCDFIESHCTSCSRGDKKSSNNIVSSSNFDDPDKKVVPILCCAARKRNLLQNLTNALLQPEVVEACLASLMS